jgi:hypothetical protein
MKTVVAYLKVISSIFLQTWETTYNLQRIIRFSGEIRTEYGKGKDVPVLQTYGGVEV